ncbi:MAG: hypothetical protein AABX52_00290 [Nanoarchaeota archaeon]
MPTVINRQSYPLLYCQRNPVRFVNVTGTVHADLAHLNSPVRFVRLRDKEDTLSAGEVMSAKEKIQWLSILGHAKQQDTPRKIGLQSGGRSALRFHPEYALIRIKGGGFYTQQFSFDSETPYGGSLEFYVKREIENYEKLTKYAPQKLFPYKPVGWYDYEQVFRGNKLYAGLFSIKGDTRLDEILVELTKTSYILKNGWSHKIVSICKHVDELCFTLGKIAGLRLRQLANTGIPWSRRFSSSNAHIGNMVLYDDNGATTIGVVDLDAAGGFMKSKTKMQDLIKDQYDMILKDLINPVYTSLSTDHILYNKGIVPGGYTLTGEGFIEGYRHGRTEYIKTTEILRILANSLTCRNLWIAEMREIYKKCLIDFRS